MTLRPQKILEMMWRELLVVEEKAVFLNAVYWEVV